VKHLVSAVGEIQIAHTHRDLLDFFLGRIHLALDLTPEKLVIHVMDEGKGFKLSDVPDPLAEENILSTSGRGIFLMRAFMDEFDVVPGSTGGAEIVMSKWLPGVVHGNGHSSASGGASPQRES